MKSNDEGSAFCLLFIVQKPKPLFLNRSKSVYTGVVVDTAFDTTETGLGL